MTSYVIYFQYIQDHNVISYEVFRDWEHVRVPPGATLLGPVITTADVHSAFDGVTAYRWLHRNLTKLLEEGDVHRAVRVPGYIRK